MCGTPRCGPGHDRALCLSAINLVTCIVSHSSKTILGRTPYSSRTTAARGGILGMRPDPAVAAAKSVARPLAAWTARKPVFQATAGGVPPRKTCRQASV